MRLRMILLSAILSLMLIGCSTWSEPGQTEIHWDEKQNVDAQNEYIFFPMSSFRETDEFYLGNNMYGQYLCFYDKSSSVSGVLCADPACDHASMSCGAYMREGASFSVHDGSLYWVAPESKGYDHYLWRSELSGMNREKLKQLSFDDFVVKYQPQFYVTHRGMLYILGDADAVSGTQVGNWLTIVATPLDDSQDFTVLYEKTIDQGVQRTVRFVGDHAYISLIIFAPGGMYDVSVEKLDLTTGESKLIYEETGLTVIPGDLWVTDRGELYLPGAGDDITYVWKIENGKRSEIVRWQTEAMSIPKVMDGIAVLQTYPDQVRHVHITDLNGEPVYSGLLFPEEVAGLPGDPNAYSIAVIGGDQDKLILNLQDFSDMSDAKDYTIMVDLNNNMKATILWSTEN